MTKEITVPSSVDDSKKLQKLIDNNGNTPAKFIFPEDHYLSIKSLIRFFNFAEVDGSGSTWELMENAPTNPFGPQVPLVAPKYTKGAEGLCIHGVIFEGNRDRQAKVPKKNGKNWGLGYHNFIGLGSNKSISFDNAVNCTFYNLEFNNSLGDNIRPEGASNILVHDIKGKNGGHDAINYSGVNGGEVYNVNLSLGVGSGVRMRSCKNIKIHDCVLDNSAGLTYGPGIQIQSTAENWIISDIEIYNNTIKYTYGPGIQNAAKVPNNGLVSIHNNIFLECGQMPASVNRPVVGGIEFTGIPMEIYDNTIVNSYGYGIVAGAYDVSSKYSSTAKIYRNIITGTRKAKKAGTSSGAGIANLVGSKYSITCEKNCLYNNLIDLYKVSNSNGIYQDPEFVGNGDYHLRNMSPCRFSNYELGRYNYTTTDDSTKMMVSCTSDEANEIIASLSNKYKLYSRA